MNRSTKYFDYDEYKSTGIDWFGEIPVSWDLVMLRRIVNKFVDYRGRTPPKTKQGVRLITASNVKNGHLDLTSEAYIDEDFYHEWMVRGFPEIGDVIVTTEAPLGEVAQIEDSGVALAQRLILLKANQDLVLNDFLKYYFLSFVGQCELYSRSTGSTAIGIKASHLVQILVALPSLLEQEAIVKFLDEESHKIDLAINELNNLESLIEQKRIGLVNQSVLFGISDDVSLETSEINWFQKLPSHWSSEYARWLFKEFDVRSSTGEEELLSVSHMTGVTSRAEKNVNMFKAESLEGYKICKPGDLVINTLWAWMGAMGVAFQEGIVSPAYHVYRQQGDYDPRYIDYLVRLPNFAKEVTRYSKGVWSSRLRLYPDEFFKIVLPVPPLEEQRQIVQYLDVETAKLDELSQAIQDTIELLQERRGALISAAVTGKIRVTE